MRISHPKRKLQRKNMSNKPIIRFAKPEDFTQLIELVKSHAIFEEADALETRNLNQLKDYIFCLHCSVHSYSICILICL